MPQRENHVLTSRTRHLFCLPSLLGEKGLPKSDKHSSNNYITKMSIDLKDIPKTMLGLGLAALSSAQYHASLINPGNLYWDEFSVLESVHAAEILIKARIAQEHPLLIFESLPKSTTYQNESLRYQHLLEHAKTFQFFDLPNRLRATTGIKIKGLA